VRVPREVADGKAKVTVSYPGWKEGNVIPATFEVPLAETKPKTTGEERFTNLLAAERDAIAAIRESGGEIDLEEGEVVAVRLRGVKITNERLRLRQFPFLRALELRECTLPDQFLERLANLENLKDLSLSGAKISAAAFARLGESSNLERLDLSRTGITDAELARLKGLTTLKKLNVSGTRVTAEGLKKLKQSLPKLELAGH
jgi:hypothetical protein